MGADLRAEPLVLTVPPIEQDRYYSLQFVDGYTYNFAYVGSRTTGNGGGKYLFAGPNWKGDKPEGVNPDPFALSPAVNFPGMVIIAGSVGVDAGGGAVDTNLISVFSNRAGTGAQYYLMAQGYRDRAPDNTGAQFLARSR